MKALQDQRGFEGDHRLQESCKDALKYRLVKIDGRFRFESVRLHGARGCLSADLAEIIDRLDAIEGCGSWGERDAREWWEAHPDLVPAIPG